MKTLLTLVILGSVVLVSADQYNHAYENRENTCLSCKNCSHFYQNQQENNNDYRSQDNDNQRTRSDQEISKKIQMMLNSGWIVKGFKHVSFDVNNGEVILRGAVDTLESKNKIEKVVREIEGVRQINNQLTIIKESLVAYSESQLQSSEKKYPQDIAWTSLDRQINAKIRDKLSSGGLSKEYEVLEIRTTNGIVVISGLIDKREDIQRMTDEVKEVEGVRSISTQLTVNGE